MSDLIITPSSGKIDFIYQSGQEISRLESITIDPTEGLVFSGKISASSVTAPLNVTATSSNINYPFVFASSGTTGAKSLLMDSAGGTYNPSTNLATIDISGTSSWASNAVTSLVCTGNAATATTASYANALNAANTYTVAGITGNLTGNVTGTATTASYANALNAANNYIVTGITGNLTGNVTGTATTASYANALNAANRYTVVGITGSLFGTSSWATNATNALQLGGTAAASYVTLTGVQNLTDKTITGTFTGALTGTATTASYANALNTANSYTIAGLTVNGNFAVNGSLTVFSASNVYITSSNLVITDNIITMNALSPYQRYAGIQMYDTGSGTLSNFLWDGDGDYFFLSGSSVNGKIITGPDSQANLSANFVPKATAGYKLGNSLIYDDGTNVGIGTTTINQKLSVTDSLSITNAAGTQYLLMGNQDSGGVNNPSVIQAANGSFSFGGGNSWSGTGGNFTSSMHLSDAGYVGIGATSFVYGAANRGLLEVYGSTDALIALRNATANFYIHKSGNNFAMVNGGAGYMTFNTNGSDRLYIDSNGYIGIATTSILTTGGNAQLSISTNTTAVALSFGASNNDMSYIRRLSAGVYQWQTYNSGNTGQIHLQPYGGSVGIGTTSPSSTLQVNSTTAGATLLRTDGTNGTLFSVVDDLSDSLMSVNNSAGLPVLEVFADDRIVMGQYGQNDFVLVNNKVGIGTNNPLAKLHVTGSASTPAASFMGNVGIGTTSPVNKLEVKGVDDATITAIFQSTSGGNDAYNGGIQLGNAASSQNSKIYHDSSGDNTLTFVSSYSSGTGNKFIFSPGGTERVRFQQNGKVGIGTTVPTSSLHIKPLALGADLLILERYATQAKLIYAYESAADGYLEVRSGADVIISKLSGYASTPSYFQSNVGIGTTNPVAKLQVNGNISGSSFTSSISNAVGFLGTSSWATNATNALQLGGTAAADYVTLTGTQTLTGKTITGTFTGNLTGTATTASYANALNAANSYTVVGITGNLTGNVTGTATTASYANALNAANSYTVTGITGALTGTSSWATNATNALQLGGTAAASYVTLTGTQTLTGKTITGTFTGNLTGTASWASNAVTALNGGVTSVSGTANQVIVSGNTGAVTFSLPQSIHTTATPTFTSVSATTFTGALTGTATTASYANNLNAANQYTVGGITGSHFGTSSWATNATNALQLGGTAAASYVTLADTQSLTNKTITGTFTGNLTGTATTASYANALNTGNSYTGVNFTATGFFQTNSGNIKSDTSFTLLTTTNGAQSVSVKGILLGTSYDTNPGANEIRTTNNTSLYLNARGTGDIQFQTADSLKMMLLNNGNVGIGTTSPSYKLEVYSGVKTSAFTGLSISNFNNYDGTAASLVTSQLRFAILENDTGTYNAPARTFAILESGNEANNSSSDGFFAISTRSNGTVAQKFRITAAGNVGIGTSSPLKPFHVHGNSGELIRLSMTSSYTASNGPQLSFWNSTAEELASVRGVFNETGQGNRANLIFGTRTSDALGVETKMTILHNGNVGIGITSPVAKLDSYFSSNAITFNYLATNLNNTSPIPTYAFDVTNGIAETRSIKAGIGYERHEANGRGTIHIYNRSSDDASNFSGTRSSAGDIKMSINNVGNVGIGIVTPNAKLDVSGVIRGDAGANYPHSFTNTDAGNTHWTNRGERLLTSNGTNWANDGRDPIMALVTSGNSNATTIANSIGLTLHNESTTDNTFSPAILFSNKSNSNSYNTAYAAIIGRKTGQGVDANWSAGELHFYTMPVGAYINNIPAMMINSAGNVGIGTTVPVAKLHINSTTAGATLLRTDGTNGTLFSVVDDLSDSLMSVNNSAGLPVLEVFADDRIVAGQYGQNDFVVVNNKVGIGTNNPLAKLHVTGSSSVPAAVLMGNVGIGTTSFVYSNANRGLLEIYGSSDALISLRNATANSYLQKSGNDFYFNNGGAGFISIATNGSERMYIKSDGNVGIGTSAPLQKLHVLGNISTISQVSSGEETNRLQFYNIGAATYDIASIRAFVGAGQANRGELGFYVNNGAGQQLAMYIDRSQNVGIGIAVPTAPLHVVGVISGSSFTGAGTGLTGTAASLTAGTATNATQFGSEANTNFMRGLAGGTEANIDTYTDNGFRTVAYTGHGKGLLSFNVGSSIGTVQHEYFYNTPANGWRIRNKTDSTTWSAWGHVVMTDGNQGLLTGLVITSNYSGTVAGLTAGAVTNGVYTTGAQSIAGNKTFTGTTIVTGSIETAAVRETFSAVSSTTTVSIDLSTATVFNLTFTSTISAFNITNVNTSRVNSFTLITAPNGTGATIAWSFQTNGGGAANVKWASNVSPTATTTTGRFDIFSFVYNGTNWYGFTGGQNYV